MSEPQKRSDEESQTLDVFISYAREETEFVRQLDDWLKQQGMKTFVDYSGIPPSTEFMQEIEEALEKAATVLFVVSPSSASSKFCSHELEYAFKYGKRVVPLIRIEVKPEALPEELRTKNWVFCRQGQEEQETAFGVAHTALTHNWEWIKLHAHYLTKALQWKREERPLGQLLRGKDIAKAEEWLKGQSGGELDLLPLHREYVGGSRTWDRRRKWIAAVSLVLLVMTGFVVWREYGIYREHALIQTLTGDATSEISEVQEDAECYSRTIRESDDLRPFALYALEAYRRSLEMKRSLVWNNEGIRDTAHRAVQRRVWRLPRLKARHGLKSGLLGADLFADEKQVIALQDGSVWRWELASGQQREQELLPPGLARSQAFLADQSLLAIGTSRNETLLFDLSQREVRAAGTIPQDRRAASLDLAVHQGHPLLAGAFGTKVRFWVSGENGFGQRPAGEFDFEPLYPSGDFFINIHQVVLSPDGKTAAVNVLSPAHADKPGFNSDLYLLDWKTKETKELARLESIVLEMEFDSAGVRLATAGEEGVNVYDVLNRRTLWTLSGLLSEEPLGPDNAGAALLSGVVKDVAFPTRPGTNLLAVATGCSARIFDLDGKNDEDREVVRAPHGSAVKKIACSGKDLVTLTWPDTKIKEDADPGELWLWDVAPADASALAAPEDLIAESCRRIGRPLTRQEWQSHPQLGQRPYRCTCPCPEDASGTGELSAAGSPRQIGRVRTCLLRSIAAEMALTLSLFSCFSPSTALRRPARALSGAKG